jgi:putative SOS response-associated peptidase YedK
VCGRYGFGNPARFDTLALGVVMPPIGPRFNVAPSQSVPFIHQDAAGRAAGLVRWGLVPAWADDPSIGNRLANARGDTIATKPSFRSAFRSRRGLMPADLFYEWQQVPGQKVKQPWCIRLPDEEPFLLGAIWEEWTPRNDPISSPLRTCAVITTEPNAVMSRIHDRMPLIVPRPHADAWLDPATSPAIALDLIRPWSGPLVSYPVSLWLNAPKHDDARCAAPMLLPEPD